MCRFASARYLRLSQVKARFENTKAIEPPSRQERQVQDRECKRKSMSEEVPLWRQAIKEDSHPLHRAAWILFGKNFNANYAAQALEGQKEDVVGFCTMLLDTRELYPESALGGGNAPVNAVQLLCKWQVETALPRLLQILEEEDWDTIVYGTTADAIASYGTALVEPLLEMATRKTLDQQQVAIAGTLADAAPGDPRTVSFIRKLFDSRKQDFEVTYMAENVLAGDPEGGINWLQERLRTRKYNKEVRQRIERYIDDAKAGKF
jgi:hypothetical protein